MMTTKLLAAGAALIFSGSIAAAAPATVSTDLNMRSGPGTEYGVVVTIPAGATVDVGGCTGSWCAVNFRGESGYASASYLSGGGGIPSAAVVVPDYGPDYAYGDDYYDYGYSYGPSIGFYAGPRFRHGWRGGWHGPRTGNWQGRPGWQGGGNRVGAVGGTTVNRGAALGSVTSLGGGTRPQMSAPAGLRSGGGAAFRGGAALGGGGARMGGGAIRAGGGPRGR